MFGLDTIEDVAAQLSAIGHNVRIRLLYRLMEGPEYVSQLARGVGAPVTNVCQHLQVMKKAGLLDCKRRGHKVLYRLRPEIISPGTNGALATLALGPYRMQLLAETAS